MRALPPSPLTSAHMIPRGALATAARIASLILCAPPKRRRLAIANGVRGEKQAPLGDAQAATPPVTCYRRTTLISEARLFWLKVLRLRAGDRLPYLGSLLRTSREAGLP